MDNYIVAVFTSDQAALDGFHALWKLDARQVAVHGAAVVRRDASGELEVAEKRTDPGVRTALGIAIGALLGALAGPVGAAAGAGVAAGNIVAGTVAGAAVGFAGDDEKSAEHEEAVSTSKYMIKIGQTAVIAEVTENDPAVLDAAMKQYGGTVYRRNKDAVRTDALWGDDANLYPYDYDPQFT